MVYLLCYWQIRRLTASGDVETQVFSDVKAWFQDRFEATLRDETLSEADCQQMLWQLSRDNDQSSHQSDDRNLAQLCLRCWLSGQIVDVCTQLARQFGANYGFTATDLLPLVLDDDGQRASAYRPLAVKILSKYDPKKGTLKTWAHHIIKNHRDLNHFLLQHGLYRISPWAILNDTRLAQLPRALPHWSPSAIEAASQLLSAYHRVYRRDRLHQRLTKPTGRNRRCPDPTEAQLREINPHEPTNVVLSQLYDLAEQLRQYRIAVRQGKPDTISLDAGPEGTQDIPATVPDEAEAEQDAFLQQYRHHFLQTLDESIYQLIEAYIAKYQARKTPQGKVYYQALALFYRDCQPMGQIAKQTGLASQVQVTRLLQLRRFRAEVCAYWLQQLQQKVRASVLKQLSAERLDEIALQLEQILIEDTSTVMDEAQAEAQIPKNRTANSVFARHLCQVLPQITPPP